jgi:hypothetical protein
MNDHHLQKTVDEGTVCVFGDEGRGDGHVTCDELEDQMTPISFISQVEVM